MQVTRRKLGWVAALVGAGTLFGTSCVYDRFGGDFFYPVYGVTSVVDDFFFGDSYYGGGYFDSGCCDYGYGYDVGYYDEDYYDDLEDYYDDLEDYYDDWWD